LGRSVHVIKDLDPTAINLDGETPPRPIANNILPADLITAQPIIHDTVPPDIAGLTELYQQGAVRNATQADWDAWLKVREREHLPIINAGLSSVYVVTRAITMPRDMFGSRSAKFLIPHGVPLPIDHGSHNTYFLVADGQCKGNSPCR
jgi:hypothetical protein